MAGLQWQTIHLPFTAGLDTKRDVRFSSPPTLDIARDIQFEQVGGVQVRHPFAAMTNTIFGGGALANCRRIDVVNGELVVFTDTGLLSWNAQLSSWVLRATHLAVTVDEQPRFATVGDQFNADRAELAGAVVFVWTEGLQVFAAALDKVTGSVLVSPVAVPSATGRARLVALTTKILLFVEEAAGTMKVRAIDPAAPATALAGAGTTVSTTAQAGLMYDVVRIGTQDAAIGVARSNANTYIAFTVNAALAIVTSTKARACDGPIALSPFPGGAVQTQVIRSNTGGTAIQGDVLTTISLADVAVNQPIAAATAVFSLTACHRSVTTGGAFRCFVFWSNEQPAATGKSNVTWVDTAGAISAPVTFVNHLGLASRAFDYAGSVYLWMTLAADVPVGFAAGVTVDAVQNRYFLLRDDGFLVAKAVDGDGGGSPWAGNNNQIGLLPGVSIVSATAFAWCALRRRSFGSAQGLTGFAARSPVDLAFSFDTNTARRTAALGNELYVAAGEVLEYDGVTLVECGFHVFPWLFHASGVTVGGSSMAAGSYAYKETWRYANARGSTERSTTEVVQAIAFAAPANAVSFSPIVGLTATHKTATVPAVEIWRTVVNAPPGAPFYLVTSKDPTVLTGSNKYLPNNLSGDVSPFTDGFADVSILGLEENPEQGTVLESLAPPGAQIIVPTETRLYLARVSGDPDRVWYSRERNDGEIASFNDGLTIDVPRPGGDLTSVWFQDEVLHVGRQAAIYAIPGVGLDNAGNGQGYGPARTVSLDVGPVSQEAQALTPIGTLFKSGKGWQLLDRGGLVRYVGGAVSAFDADTVLAMHVMTSLHQVRVLTSARVLVWDYRGAVDAALADGIGHWAEWTIADGLHATIWNGQYVYLTATGPKGEQTALSGMTYGLDVETSWIKLADLQGFGKLGAIEVLGEYRSAHLLRVRVARDYQYDGAGNVVYFDDKAWTPSPTVVGNALQVRHRPSGSNGNGEAFKVRLTAVTELQRAGCATLALSTPVATRAGAGAGTPWATTFLALAANPGEMGNRLTLNLVFEDGSPFSIDVRDHFAWRHDVQRWVESLGTVGVRVLCRAGASPTVAQLEVAIAANSTLINLNSNDGNPTHVVDATVMANVTTSVPCSGGAYGPPSGEALRLTGLGLEVGINPALLNRRLPAEQKQ